MRRILAIAVLLASWPPHAVAAQAPSSSFATPDGAILVHTPVLPARVDGVSVAGDADIVQIVVTFRWSLDAGPVGDTNHCATLLFPFGSSPPRIEWSAPLCWPVDPQQRPPSGHVIATVYAIDAHGDVESPGPSITLLVL